MTLKSRQIIDALKTEFRSIVGDNGVTYNFTPAAVVSFHGGLADPLVDPGRDVIYVLIPRDEEMTEQDSCNIGATLRMDLVLCKRYEPATENPHQVKHPDRGELQDMLLYDALKKVGTPTTAFALGYVSKIVPEFIDRSPETTFVEKWAVVFMTLRIEYWFRFGAP